MADSIRLSPHPTAAWAARQFVDGTLCRRGRDDLAEIAVLLTSELATNAFLHAHSDMVVELELERDRLRVTVFDTSDDPPHRRQSTARLEQSGRGLGVVDALAAAWGVNNWIHGGKSVWFELAA